MIDRAERQVKQNPLRAMLGINRPIVDVVESQVDKKESPKKPKKEETKKKANEKAYMRYRGKTEQGEISKAMSYYITDSHIKGIELRLQKGMEKDKSAVVRAALEQYLSEELKYLGKSK